MQDATDGPRGSHALRVDSTRIPGSVSGTDRVPTAGERVYTHEGTAVVIRVVGRTGPAGRLLELKMDDGREDSFFAASTNVRVARRSGDPLPVIVEPHP